MPCCAPFGCLAFLTGYMCSVPMWKKSFPNPNISTDMTPHVREGSAHLNKRWPGLRHWFARVGQLWSANHHQAAQTVGPTSTSAYSGCPALNGWDQWQCSTWNINHPIIYQLNLKPPMFHVEHHPPTLRQLGVFCSHDDQHNSSLRRPKAHAAYHRHGQPEGRCG